MKMFTFPLLLVLISFLPSTAQWQATNIWTNAFSTIGSVESHNGILFGASNNSGFVKSTNSGMSWQAVNQNGFTTNPISQSVTHIQSAGSSLYVVTFNAIYASSMVYVSTDNGQNFVADTSGIPKVNTGNNQCVNIDRLYYHNGYLIADVANLGNWIKPVSGNTWVKNDHSGTQWSELFGFYDSKIYTHGNYHTYVSSDNGTTWTQAADGNLPGFFTAEVLNVNPANGRIYITGRDIVNQQYRLLYSDDEGASWDSLAIHPYLGSNWLGGKQRIYAMYSNDNYIQLALDNDQNNSAPDILVSTDGGSSFAADIAGLPTTASQTVTAIKFTLHEDFLFMALNFIDIYRKNISTTGVIESIEPKAGAFVYPNPVIDYFKIQNIAGYHKGSVADSTGKTMFKIEDITQPVQVTVLPAGLYIISLEDEDGRVQNIKFLKK